MNAMRSNASRVTGPEGCAEHQTRGLSAWPSARAWSTKPAIGRLTPFTASMSAAPRHSPGHASACTKSSKLARLAANVLVSCWTPPMAIRLMRNGRASAPQTCRASDGLFAELLVDAIESVPERIGPWCAGGGKQVELLCRAQRCDADTEKPNRGAGLRLQPRLEQAGCDPDDEAAVLRGRRKCPLTRVGREVASADLHIHLAGHELARAHALAGAISEARKLRIELVMLANVVLERLLGADRLFFP